VQLRVELSASEQNEHREVHPRQQNDDAADRAVGLVVRREVGDVETKEQRDEEPEHRRGAGANENLFRILFQIRQVPIDQKKREHDHGDRNGILGERPGQHEIAIESHAHTDSMRDLGSSQHHEARYSREQPRHKHRSQL